MKPISLDSGKNKAGRPPKLSKTRLFSLWSVRLTDTMIARVIKCSPTAVANWRKAEGLSRWTIGEMRASQ